MAMVASMTGQASRTGAGAGHSWAWDLRSVNAKGLDLRLRLPEGIEGLEPLVRAALSARFQRGNVSLTLRLAREAEASPMRVNPQMLAAVLDGLATVAHAAEGRGMVLRPASSAEVLAFRGVCDSGAPPETDGAALRAALLADLDLLVADLAAARAAEGAALGRVLAAQVDLIAALTAEAATEAAARRGAMAASLRENLARVLENSEGVDETRLAQELALLAVRADITEETDRLTAHVEAARALLRADGAVGRKLDFLTQEFNREANTLCSKAQSIALTRVGLDLKTVIDQMREQVQNVE
jgi:uncharacterized protein (TIGR00255 family)